MYSVSHRFHEIYGLVVEIVPLENGNLSSPFDAVHHAFKERRRLEDSNYKKIRFMIDSQVLSMKQVERWAKEEYKSLPKCDCCAIILNDIFTHQLSEKKFCSKVCADKDYIEESEKLKDEYECDYD